MASRVGHCRRSFRCRKAGAILRLAALCGKQKITVSYQDQRNVVLLQQQTQERFKKPRQFWLVLKLLIDRPRADCRFSQPEHARRCPVCRKSPGNRLPDITPQAAQRAAQCLASVARIALYRQCVDPCNRGCDGRFAGRACVVDPLRYQRSQLSRPRSFLTSSAACTFSCPLRTRSSTPTAR